MKNLFITKYHREKKNDASLFSLAAKPQQMSLPLPGKLCLDPYA